MSEGSEGLERVLCQCGVLSTDVPCEPWKRMWGREVGHGANAQRPCVASNMGQMGAPTDPWGRRQEGEQLRAGDGAGRMPRLGAPHPGVLLVAGLIWRLWCRGPEPCSPVHPGSSLSIELPSPPPFSPHVHRSACGDRRAWARSHRQGALLWCLICQLRPQAPPRQGFTCSPLAREPTCLTLSRASRPCLADPSSSAAPAQAYEVRSKYARSP